MVAVDEEALICDFAETYNILDWRELPCRTAAILASGLRNDSRIKMKINGMRYSTDTLLLASACYRLSFLVWAKTKDGQKGRNRPKSIFEKMIENIEEKAIEFNSVEEFEKYRKTIIERRKNNG